MRVTSTFITLLAACCFSQAANAGLIITGVIDGPLSGGVPKAVELYADTDVADLSQWNISSETNGGSGTPAPEFTLSK